MLQLISDSNLRHLHLLQNSYSPPGEGVAACSSRAWYSLKHTNPKLKVHLEIDSNAYDAEIVIQLDAPVYSIVYTMPNTKVRKPYIRKAIDSPSYIASIALLCIRVCLCVAAGYLCDRLTDSR